MTNHCHVGPGGGELGNCGILIEFVHFLQLFCRQIDTTQLQQALNFHGRTFQRCLRSTAENAQSIFHVLLRSRSNFSIKILFISSCKKMVAFVRSEYSSSAPPPFSRSLVSSRIILGLRLSKNGLVPC